MTLVNSVINRTQELQDVRLPWEKMWNDLLRYAFPLGGRDFFTDGRTLKSNLYENSQGERRGRNVYDSTSIWAVDRLTSGMESLTTPNSEKWHGLGSSDPLAPEPSDEEREWYDRYRDYLFAARYEPSAGFQNANQNAIRTTIALGTGIFFLEEGNGSQKKDQSQIPFRYETVPLSECLIAVDSQNEPDTLYRRMSLTARQMVQKFGEENVSLEVKQLNDSDTERERKFEVIHAVFPREERGGSLNTNRNAPFASIWVDRDNQTLLGESGFFEFPYVIYYWQQDGRSAYGESPVMVALAEIKSLNLLAKQSMRAAQQFTNPAVAIPNDGVIKRINLNPGQVNPGAIDENGRLKVQPIITAQNPGFIEQVMNVKRDSLRETMMINLFQILVDNPQMTATEVLQRASEKGELLGPAGGKIQKGLSHMVDRETAILQRKGAFDTDAPLTPPESLIGRPFEVRFTSPLDRLRRSNELIGIQRTYEFAGQVAQFDPSILDRLDGDAALDVAQEVTGAPRRVLRQKEEVDQLREQRAQQEAQQQQLAAIQQAGEAAQAAVPAAQQGIELLDQLGGEPQ